MNSGEIIVLLAFIFASVRISSSHVPRSRLILEYDWPVPKKNLMRFPHPKSCNHFYLAKPDGSYVVKKCNDEEMFDYKSLQCRDRPSSKCWKDAIQRITSKKPKKDFLCPFPWGLYPDIEDCLHFYECLGGTSFLRICPESTAFDKAERTCVPVKEAMCADESDVVEPGYGCPYKWGYYTHPNDCSKYYECLRRVPSIKTCKRNMLFDNIERRCIPMNNVKCGRRFNPYDRKVTTTGFVDRFSPEAEFIEITTKKREFTDENIERTEQTKYPKTGFSKVTPGWPKTESSRFPLEHPRPMSRSNNIEQARTEFSRITPDHSKIGLTKVTTEQPWSGYSRITASLSKTENLKSEEETRIPKEVVDEFLRTGYSRFTTENLRTEEQRKPEEVADKRSGTGYSSITTENPRSEKLRQPHEVTEKRSNADHSRDTTKKLIAEVELRRTKLTEESPRTEYSMGTTGNLRTEEEWKKTEEIVDGLPKTDPSKVIVEHQRIVKPREPEEAAKNEVIASENPLTEHVEVVAEDSGIVSSSVSA